MTESRNSESAYSADNAIPQWMSVLLTICARDSNASISSRFRERCTEAALAAQAVRSLRKTATRIGFEPLPWSEYIKRLADVAGVPLEPLLRSLGVSFNQPHIDLDEGSSVAVRLAIALAIPVKQLLVHLRFALLTRSGLPVAQLCRLRIEGVTGDAHVSSVEAALDELHKELTPSVRAEYEELEVRVVRFYRAFS